jgi:hypothetical protein
MSSRPRRAQGSYSAGSGAPARGHFALDVRQRQPLLLDLRDAHLDPLQLLLDLQKVSIVVSQRVELAALLAHQRADQVGQSGPVGVVLQVPRLAAERFAVLLDDSGGILARVDLAGHLGPLLHQLLVGFRQLLNRGRRGRQRDPKSRRTHAAA